MYAKGKGSTVPSDAQAREKLALYVYEYLLHVGAQKSAQTFLSEIRWEKNITLGEPPGFLHSWWCVFWDLYCAAPERRETCDHSSEAKAFHDYRCTFLGAFVAQRIVNLKICFGFEPGHQGLGLSEGLKA
ncbi:single-stranded DNA-binding protein [Plakobranchus ocellatus]|uniref:Single-stranded DNA-binding protein n=1 Tax=Plakobranchus ocellatus TaxID=259542 RepID=A0AAV4BEL5_9GAST|nr:single-stranded DNA-binding protein [Plakobranchus ocellatus]